MTGQNYRGSGVHCFVDERGEFSLKQRVESGCWLVEQEDSGVLGEGEY